MSPQRYFTILCGILGVLVVAGAGGYYLASRSLTSGTAELSQRLGDEQLANQKLDDLGDLQKQYQRLQPLIPVIDNALPTEKDQSTIAVQLHNIAQSSGMDLESLTFAPTVLPGPISQTVPVGSVLAVPITFQLTGNYGQLQQFLQSQELLNRYTSMTSLTINADNPNELVFDIGLNAFVKP